MARFGFSPPYGATRDTPQPRITITRESRTPPDDPLVYIQLRPASYMKIARSEAAAYCKRHGLPVAWEERDAREERLVRERAARPKPVKGSLEELSRRGR